MKDNSGKSSYGWIIVIAGFFVTAIAFGTQYSFGTFFKPIQESFGWSRGAVSWAITIHLLFYAAGNIVAGWAADKYGVRRVVLIAALLVGLGLGLSSRISSLWQLYLLYGLPLALGMSACWTPIVTIIPGWFDKRGLPLGIVAAGTGTGTLVMLPLSTILIDSYGWRNAFIIIGLACWSILTVCALFIKKARFPSPTEKQNSLQDVRKDNASLVAQTEGVTFKEAVKTRGMAYIFISQMLIASALRMVMTHSIPHITDMGITASTAALIVGVIGGSSIVGRLVMGAAQERLDPRRALLLCVGLQSLTLLGLPFLNTSLLFFLFALIFGFTYGGDVPQMPSITIALFGMKNLGTIYGVVQFAAGLGGSMGPVLAGYLFDLTASYTVAFIIAAAGLVIAFFVIYRLKLPKSGPT